MQVKARSKNFLKLALQNCSAVNNLPVHITIASNILSIISITESASDSDDPIESAGESGAE